MEGSSFGRVKINDYNYYLGVPHCHTGYSDGSLTPYDALKQAKEKNLDFLFITDHSNYLNSLNTESNNINFSKWISTGNECEAFNIKNSDFLALRGFEMTSSNWGHINVLNSKTYVEAKKQMKRFGDFINWLRNQDNIVVTFNHPNRSFKYIPCNEVTKELFSLMEVGNGAPPRKYIRTEKYYFGALDRGWHLGAINGQDNHRDNWGGNSNLTAILSNTLLKNDIIDALKNRRTYSTETGNLKLYFEINERVMGSVLNISEGENLYFNVYAIDDDNPIEEIQLITNRGMIINYKKFMDFEAKWDFKLNSNNSSNWYVIKVIHRNKKWGISSAIFVNKKNK